MSSFQNLHQSLRKQVETLNQQTKQLAALAQKVTLATAEPLKTGVAEARTTPLELGLKPCRSKPGAIEREWYGFHDPRIGNRDQAFANPVVKTMRVSLFPSARKLSNAGFEDSYWDGPKPFITGDTEVLLVDNGLKLRSIGGCSGAAPLCCCPVLAGVLREICCGGATRTQQSWRCGVGVER